MSEEYLKQLKEDYEKRKEVVETLRRESPKAREIFENHETGNHDFDISTSLVEELALECARVSGESYIHFAELASGDFPKRNFFLETKAFYAQPFFSKKSGHPDGMDNGGRMLARSTKGDSMYLAYGGKSAPDGTLTQRILGENRDVLLDLVFDTRKESPWEIDKDSGLFRYNGIQALSSRLYNLTPVEK